MELGKMKYEEYIEALSKCTWSNEDAKFLELIEQWKKGEISFEWYQEWFKWEKQLETFENYIQEKRLRNYEDGPIDIDYTPKEIVNNAGGLAGVNIGGVLAYIILHGGIEKIGNFFTPEHFLFDVKKEKFEEYLTVRLMSDCKEVLYIKGNLHYKHLCISNLTDLEKKLCEVIMHDLPNEDILTKKIIEHIYGRDDEQGGDEKVRSLMKGVNKKTKEKFKIPKFIRFGVIYCRRLI